MHRMDRIFRRVSAKCVHAWRTRKKWTDILSIP